ncbi:hypothetical protein GCM10027341_50050 [Spirosoma knui]
MNKTFTYLGLLVLCILALSTATAQTFNYAKLAGSSLDDRAVAIAKDQGGNSYVTGYYRTSIDFGDGFILPGTSSSNAFICKIGPTGTTLWAKRITTNSGSNQTTAIAVDNAGNVYTTGSYSGPTDFNPDQNVINSLPTTGGNDIFVLKLNTDGNYVWVKSYGGVRQGGGGTTQEEGKAIAVDGAGMGIYVTGSFTGPSTGTGVINFGTGEFRNAAPTNDVFVLKLNADGSTNWAGTFGNSVVGSGEASSGIALSPDASSVYLTGFFQGTLDFDLSPTSTANVTSTSLQDAFILKLSAAGVYQWAKATSGASTAFVLLTTGNGIAATNTGVYATGHFRGTLDFDPNPCSATNLTSAGLSDIYVWKLDASGNFRWAKQIGGTTDDASGSIALDANEGVYLTGSFSGTADLNPDPAAQTNFTSMSGSADVFALKLSSTGSYLAALNFGAKNFDYGSGIAPGSSSEATVVGAFQRLSTDSGQLTIDFDPSPATNSLQTKGDRDAFIASYTAFPNPLPPTVITGEPASSSTICPGGAVSVSVTAEGPGTLTYQWYKTNSSSPVAGQTTSTLSLSSVTVEDAGCYFVIATGSGGSAQSRNFVLTVASPTINLVSSGTLTCTQTSLTLTAEGGNNYRFSGPGLVSSDPQSGTAIVNASGLYSVTATGANGCSAVQTTTVASNTALPGDVTLNASSTLTCAQASVQLQAASTTPGVTFAFSGPDGFTQANGATATVTLPGIYSLTVTGSNGCVTSTTTEVVSNTVSPQGIDLSVSNVLTCAQPTAVLSASSSTGNVSFVISGPTNQLVNASSTTISQSGAYTLVVTGVNGCSASLVTQVTRNTAAPENVTLLNDGPLTCIKTSVQLAANGGIEGSSYLFNGPGVTSQTASSSIALANVEGPYSVTVTNPNGCTAAATTQVLSNTTAPQNLSLTNDGPLTCAKTSVSLTASSSTTGTLSYTFSGPGVTSQTGSSVASANESGTYLVTVRAPNGCTASVSAVVEGNTSAPQNVTLVNDGAITCAKPTVLLTAASSTTGSLSFSFAGPFALTQDGTASATANGPGTYTVTVAGPNGCTATATTTVESNTTAPEANLASSGTVTCANPTVTLTATPADQSSYVFSGPGLNQSGASATALITAGGLYSLTVTSANGCSTVATTTVESNTTAPQNVSLTNNGPLSCAQTSVTLSVTSSTTGPLSYSYAGPGVTGQNGGSMAMATVEGLYSLTVTGANGCTATATTEVASNTVAPEANLTSSATITCANPSVTLTAKPAQQSRYTFAGPSSFAQSGTTATASVTASGTYSVTVTGVNGCTATAITEVFSNTVAPQNVTLSSSGTLTCSQTSVNLLAGSTTEGVTYSVAGPEGFSANGSTVSVSRPGTYSVTATGTNGCAAVQTTTVAGNTSVSSITLTNSGPLSFTNASVTLTATTTPSDTYSYSFSNGAAQQGTSNTARVTTAGVYSVTITGSNGCSSIASTTVTGGSNPTVCRGGTAVISVAVSGAPVKYEWFKNSLTTPKLMETPQLFRGTATSSLTLINAQTNTQGNFYLKTTDQAGTVTIYGPYRLTVDASCRAREVVQLETPLQVELAPNPIQQDRLRAVVRGVEGRVLQVELVDLSGKPIRQQRWQQADAQQLIDWDMQRQGSGLYLLQIVSEAGNGTPAQRQSVKVVKP